jgi:hypothetical protein
MNRPKITAIAIRVIPCSAMMVMVSGVLHRGGKLLMCHEKTQPVSDLFGIIGEIADPMN